MQQPNPSALVRVTRGNLPPRMERDVAEVYGPVATVYVHAKLGFQVFVHMPDDRGYALYSMPNLGGRFLLRPDVVMLARELGHEGWAQDGATSDLDTLRGFIASFPVLILGEMGERLMVDEALQFGVGHLYEHEGIGAYQFADLVVPDCGGQAFQSEGIIAVPWGLDGQRHHKMSEDAGIELARREALCLVGPEHGPLVLGVDLERLRR